jgi:hypothetical protein
MAYALIMQEIMPTNMRRIQRTRMDTAPEWRKRSDQRAIGITMRKPVPTMASVASESRSDARGVMERIVEFGSWTSPGEMGGFPRERIGASIKACIAAEPPKVRQ